MSVTQIELQGTLQSDGTLVLDQKPNLPAGRVTVVLSPARMPVTPKEDWWEFMQRARRELEEAGSSFMNDEEMAAHIAWLREEDRIDEMLKELDATKKGQPGC